MQGNCTQFFKTIFLLSFLFGSLNTFSQKQSIEYGQHTTADKFKAEQLWLSIDQKKLHQQIIQATKVSVKETDLFFAYLKPAFRKDMLEFLEKASYGIINESNIEGYITDRRNAYIASFTEFRKDKSKIIAPLAQKKQSPFSRIVAIPTGLVTPLGVGEPCTNIDFEKGNTDGWIGGLGEADVAAPANGKIEPINMTPSFDHHTIMTGGNDEIIGSALPRVAPGSKFSLRLEDTKSERHASVISQTFQVSPDNSSFIYKYAVVLEEPVQGSQEKPHEDWQRPYFQVTLIDENGNEVPCSEYKVIAKPPLTDFTLLQKYDNEYKITRNYYWKNWTTVAVPLDKYMGQNVTLKFTASDCALKAHLGYAYLDGACLAGQTLGIQSSNDAICGEVSATLTAPEGFTTYQWTGPGITSHSDTRQITANQPGLYEVMLTPIVTDVACQQSNQRKLQYTLQTGTTFTAGPDLTLCKGDAIPLQASGGHTYTWTPTTGLNNPNIASPLASPAVTTTYVVTSCGKSDTMVVTVGPKPVVDTPKDTVYVCYGNAVTLSATGANTYKWTAEDPPFSAIGASVTLNPTESQMYYVEGTINGSCSNKDSVMVIVNKVKIMGNGIICFDEEYAELEAFGAKTYTWSPATGLDKTNGAIVHANPDVPTVYTVTGVDKEGCTTQEQIFVYRAEEEFLEASAEKYKICKGESVKLQATGVSGYIWFPFEGLDNPFIANPVATPTSTTTYTVMSPTGCSEIQLTIEVDAVDLGPDQAICRDEKVILSANYIHPGPVLDCEDYEIEQIPFLPLAETGTIVTLTNEMSSALPIGFNFTFYCNTYSQFYASANGFISFSNINSNLPQFLPDDAKPNNLIAFAWTDLVLQAGSKITYYTDGVAPNRKLVVSYKDILHAPRTAFEGPGFPVTAQVILYESTNIIEIHITAMPSNGKKHTMGMESLENADGTLGDAIEGRNLVGTWSAYNEAWRFKPPQSVVYSWAASTGEIITEKGNTLAVKPDVTTEYIVSLFNGSCSTKDTILITVNSRPDVAITGNTEICAGESTQLTATISSPADIEYYYYWSPATGLDKTQGLQVTAKPDQTTTYKVDVIDGNGCKNSVSVTVIVNPLPDLIISKDTVICNGSYADLKVTGAQIYAWTSSTGEIIIETDGNIRVTPTQTTTYTVEGTDVKGCKKTTRVTVAVAPTSLVFPTDKAICAGESVDLKVSGGSNYQWKIKNTSGVFSTDSEINITPAITTMYTISAKDTCDNVFSEDITVTVHQLPIVKANPQNKTICQGESLHITANGAVNYTWTILDGTIIGVGNSIQVNPSADIKYIVIGSSGANCQSQDTVSVIVNPLPEVTISQDVTICKGSATDLRAEGAQAYIWTSSTGEIITETTGNLKVSPTQTTVYTVTGTSSNGCKKSAQVKVTVPQTSLTVSPDKMICLGEALILKATGAADYAWSVAGVALSTNPELTVSPKETTIYTISAKDDCNNLVSKQISITVNPLPVVTASADTNICIGETAQLKANGAKNYIWITGKDTVSTAQNVHVKPERTTTYYVTGIDQNGCQNKDTIIVHVATLPVITASKDISICAGEFADLRISGGVSYEWSTVDGVLSDKDSIRVMPLKTTIYTAKVFNANGCSRTAKVTVIIRKLFLPADTAICSGRTVILNAGIGYDEYIWSPAVGLDITKGSQVTASPETTTTYTVKAISAGCSETGTIKVLVVPTPEFDLGEEQLLCEGEQITLRAEKGHPSYQWTKLVGDNWEMVSGTDSVFTTSSAGFYRVVVTNSIGCSLTDTVRITACNNLTEKYPVYIPNIITPNNDNANDSWEVKNIDKYGNNYVVIYNRWGEEVYKTANYHNEWKGEDSKNGVYYYYIKLEKGNLEYKGWIHVLR